MKKLKVDPNENQNLRYTIFDFKNDPIFSDYLKTYTEYVETYRHLQVSLVCKTKYVVNGTTHEGEMILNALNLMFAPGLNMTPPAKTPSPDSDVQRHEEDNKKQESKDDKSSQKEEQHAEAPHWTP